MRYEMSNFKILKICVWLALTITPFFTTAQSGGCYGYGTGNHERAHDVLETRKGVLVAGETNQNNGDAYLMKFDHDGQKVVWEQTYGTGNQDIAKAVVEHNGDYFFAGHTKQAGNKDVFIVQVDTTNGNVKNHKVLGGSNIDVGNDIIETNGGNLAIAGHTKTTTGANSILTFIIDFSMTSSSFSINQQFAYGTKSNNDGIALEQDSDNDYWVVGDDKNNDGSGLIYKLNQNFSNNTQNDIIYKALVNDNNNKQKLNDIEEDGNHVITAGTGKFANSVEKSSSIGDKAAFAIKLDHTHQNNPGSAYAPVTQMKEFGTGNTDMAKSLATSGNGYAFTGRNSNNDNMLSFKIKTDFSSVIWNQIMGGSNTTYGNSIIKLNSGNYFNAGKSQYSGYTNSSEHFFLTNVANAGSNCCGNSTTNTFKDVSLDQSKTLSNSPLNSSFSIDELKLKSNQSTLSSPTTSSPDGAFDNGSSCGALPVEFMGFNLSKNPDQQIQVEWRTASETNNDFFTVMRASENKDFKPVNRKDGQGTVTFSNTYQYLDRVPESGTYYYKIRQTDFDGSTSASSVKAITIGKQEEFGLEGIQVNESNLQISLNGVKSQNLVFEVFNSYSQRLGHRALAASSSRQKIQISIPEQSSQFYYIRVLNTKTGDQLAGKKVFSVR